mgnify:CR=1 FL=1
MSPFFLHWGKWGFDFCLWVSHIQWTFPRDNLFSPALSMLLMLRHLRHPINCFTRHSVATFYGMMKILRLGFTMGFRARTIPLNFSPYIKCVGSLNPSFIESSISQEAVRSAPFLLLCKYPLARILTFRTPHSSAFYSLPYSLTILPYFLDG